ncbi:MAG TPA: T9SS type A sorting domain-containing protein [Chitinophagales bacterium]|nr:T9SS type A sorting domain-containing protein [Chitinophagales bacterium]HRP38322.1 T9SS type A sorting domain-containing protein [Chitinophagales bacterium]
MLAETDNSMKIIRLFTFIAILLAVSTTQAQKLVYDLAPPTITVNNAARTVSFDVVLPQNVAVKGGVANCYLYKDTAKVPDSYGELFSFFAGAPGQNLNFIATDVKYGCYFSRFAVLTDDSTYHFSNIVQNICVEVPNAIEELSNNLFGLYPNPATNTINVKSEANTNITITNLAGVRVLESTIQAGENNINISMLPQGLYFIKSGSQKAQKFLKQ